MTDEYEINKDALNKLLEKARNSGLDEFEEDQLTNLERWMQNYEDRLINRN